MKNTLVLPLLLLLLLAAGCQQKPQPTIQPPPAKPAAEAVEETDFSCAYFYFLWGRQAELALQFPEALEAYEKALICDPDADYIIRKLPVILLRMNRGEEAVEMLKAYLERKPADVGIRMLLARVYIGLGKNEEAAGQYLYVHRQDPEEITALMLLSELYLNENNLPEAEKTLQKVLQVDSEAYPAYVLLGRIYLSTDRLDLSLAAYDKALALNWSPELLLEKSEILRLREEYDELIAVYRKILEEDPGNEPAALSLINVLVLEEREEEALAELDRLKARADHSDRADLSMARIFARMKKFDQSIAILRAALNKGDSPDARYLLAVVLVQVDEYEQALTELRLIGRKSEEYENALTLQVRILRHLDRTEQAIELLEGAVKDEAVRSPNMYVMLAALYQLQNKTELGRGAFDRAMSAFPENSELLYEYGLFLDTTGKPDEAVSVMEEVIKRQPEHGEALNYVGYTWADKNIHLDKALEYIQRAVKLNPDNGFVRDSLGWVYYRLGRFDDARQELEEAVRLSEEDPTILEHLGDVYFALGRKSDGLATFRKALSHMEEGSNAHKNLAEKVKYLEGLEKK